MKLARIWYIFCMSNSKHFEGYELPDLAKKKRLDVEVSSPVFLYGNIRLKSMVPNCRKVLLCHIKKSGMGVRKIWTVIAWKKSVGLPLIGILGRIQPHTSINPTIMAILVRILKIFIRSIVFSLMLNNVDHRNSLITISCICLNLLCWAWHSCS